jgi:hypothetical protein
MKFNGDGLSFRGTVPSTGANITVQQRTENFELPSLLNIGGAYILTLAEKHDITFAANFTSNSFSRDQIIGGLEYSFNKMFNLTSVLNGPTGGFSFQTPLGKESKSTFSIDYAYRTTSAFTGVHTIGARINL